MNIQIYGAGFHNHGAWLMLETTIAELRKRLADVERLEFSSLPLGATTYDRTAEYRIRTILPQRSRRHPARYLASTYVDRKMLAEWRDVLGVVSRDDVDALVDISGYAFGDHWGFRNIRHHSKRCAFMHDRGKPVVMLPQMLGPFENPEVRGYAKKLFSSVHRVYVRDEASLAAVKPIIDDPKKLSQAPDITIFASGVPGEARRPFACIVPNQRMFDQGADEWGDRYFQLLLKAVERILGLDLDVVLLNHAAGDGDLAIARRLARKVDSSRVEVVTGLTPAEAKGLISQSQLVVSSRFHALVASLSTGVPAVALGWAHKYPTLLADFGVPELNFESAQSDEAFLDLIDQCFETDTRTSIQERLVEAKQKMIAVNEAMWQEVTELLRTGIAGS